MFCIIRFVVWSIRTQVFALARTRKLRQLPKLHALTHNVHVIHVNETSAVNLIDAISVIVFRTNLDVKVIFIFGTKKTFVISRNTFRQRGFGHGQKKYM